MASSGLVLSCLFFISLALEAESESQTFFVKVVCQKSEVVAQFGSNTLLDCVVQSQTSITETLEIVMVTWTLNGAPVLEFFRGKQKPQTPGFQFASGPFTASNMNVSLLITDTNLTHAGEYECEILTDSGENKEKVHLDVRANYSKPQIKSDPEEIDPDKSFTLTCTALGGFPKGDIRWVVGDLPWINNPEVKVEKNQNGLFDLTSTLPFGSETKFRKFVCEVYNAKGEKEGEGRVDIVVSDKNAGNKPKENSYSHIVAPVVVFGSLIVGLLVALILCRRRRQSEKPVINPDEETLDLKPGENLTLECSNDCDNAKTSEEFTGMYLYRDHRRVAYYNNNPDKFVPSHREDVHRIVRSGVFERNKITIRNVSVHDSGFYRCSYYINLKCEAVCDMYSVHVTEVSTQKPQSPPPTAPVDPCTATSAPILTIIIIIITTAVVSVTITVIFTLCVIPKIHKWMNREEEGNAQMHNVYEVMTRNGFRTNQRTM
ncbi:uncharacterized protein LOC117375335 isoform X2 [Periophthalmus magnuspinnatus]|uniref:uncharacterized protein LOC117375335 isoform X2 n=1 Tax=Periophthalmus magnuspinnatus TaxID=409849 RepID=UPI0024369D33|nr:uncharacterized protein LOC117375335 isoform X2 [Periophthalmus magnuspinnatus]